jgi:hypothetical protein
MDFDLLKRLAEHIANRLSPQERDATIKWLERLLDIRNSSGRRIDKAKEAIRVTLEAKIVWPVVKVIGADLKKIGWGDRSWAARLAGGGILATILVAGHQGAGIAALGGAIGVPLWIVLGAGAAFAGMLLEELLKLRPR